MTEIGVHFDEVMIDADGFRMEDFSSATNDARTVPQIIIDGTLIGGFSELANMRKKGELDALV